MITDESRRQITSLDAVQHEQQTQHREHQTRIKHRSVKGQTYRLKIFNKNIILPFDRLWLLTVFDRYIKKFNRYIFSLKCFLMETKN